MNRLARIRQLASGKWAVQTLTKETAVWLHATDPWADVSEHETEREAELCARDILEPQGASLDALPRPGAGSFTESFPRHHSCYWLYPRRSNRVAV